MGCSVAKSLTRRDMTLLEAVTLRVPLLTDHQAGRIGWSGVKEPWTAAWHRAGELERAGYLIRSTILAHPEQRFEGPLATWAPRGSLPDFGNLSYQLSRRWKEDVVMTRVIGATAQSARLMGGEAPGTVRPAEATHAVQMGALFLHFLEHRAEAASRWRGEGGLKQRRGSGQRGETPDALIRPGGGSATVAIELGGRYRAERLMRLHQFCKERGWGYELW